MHKELFPHIYLDRDLGGVLFFQIITWTILEIRSPFHQGRRGNLDKISSLIVQHSLALKLTDIKDNLSDAFLYLYFLEQALVYNRCSMYIC